MSWRPSALVLGAQAVAVGCFGAAMALYPGGAQHAPEAAGHSFWLNYLCDLTEAHARNGAPNAGATFARVGMAALIAGLGVVFAYAPRAFASVRLARVVRASGAACVLATLGVPLSAMLGVQALHDGAVFVAGPLGLVACAAVVLGLREHALPTLLGALALLAATVDLIAYAHGYATGAPSIVLPIAQRVALLALLAWMLAVALQLARASRAERITPRGASTT